jgi:predicted transcriptional regulator
MADKGIPVLSCRDEANLASPTVTRDELIKELTREFLDQTFVPENAITMAEFMENTGTTRDKARNYLEKQISNGIMKKRKVAGVCYYYRE